MNDTTPAEAFANILEDTLVVAKVALSLLDRYRDVLEQEPFDSCCENHQTIGQLIDDLIGANNEITKELETTAKAMMQQIIMAQQTRLELGQAPAPSDSYTYAGYL